jgi:hypothetical protein
MELAPPVRSGASNKRECDPVTNTAYYFRLVGNELRVLATRA